MARKHIILIPIFLDACSTVIEEQASIEYQPVYPVEVTRSADLLPTGGIYSDRSNGLFAMDRRATQVGDILTVELDESFSASKKQSSSGNKQATTAIPLGDLVQSPVINDMLDNPTSRNFSGTGQASQSNSLTGRMSVSVVRILPGGNLEILGQKKLTLNNGDEYIRLRGIVRPADINANNIVSSDRIANAEIKYIGAGQIADTSKQGWLSKVTDAISPF